MPFEKMNSLVHTSRVIWVEKKKKQQKKQNHFNAAKGFDEFIVPKT